MMPRTFRLHGIGTVFGLFLGLALLLPGCAGTYDVARRYTPAPEETDKIVYKDLSLHTNLVVMDVITDNVNGMLRVRSKVKNRGRGLVNAEVKIKFVDKDGMEIGQGAPWLPMPIEGGEVKTFDGLANSAAAVDYRILIQLAGSH
jgi:uncharacterized protein YcfL